MGQVLIILLIVLGVITLVGHGIWVLLAAILRAVTGGTRAPATEKCPFCDRLNLAGRQRCDWCGRELRTEAAAQLRDVAGFERIVRRLERAEEIDVAEAQELLTFAASYRQRLAPAPASPAAQPRPAVVLQTLPETAKPAVPPRVEPVAPLVPPAVPAASPFAVSATPADMPPVPATAEEGRMIAREVVGEKKSPEAVPVPRAAPPAAQPARPAAPPAPPKPPRKPWLETLTEFLEERNIRWAEFIGVLIGGLLIVGSSIALVITLWEPLGKLPVLKFVVFVAFSSLIFGFGFYAHYRWKLASTAQGLLIIATLLVPLNFLAMGSLGGAAAATAEAAAGWSTLLTRAWEIASLGIFAWLVWLAGKALAPSIRWSQVIAVVGASAIVLLTGWIAGANTPPGQLLTLGLVAAAVFVASVGGQAVRDQSRPEFRTDHADATLLLLGTGAFSLAIALGLVAACAKRAAGLSLAMDLLALPVALAAAPVLAAGLGIMQAMSRDRAQAGYRTAGTVVALVGIGLLVAGLALAWPQPAALICVGLAGAAALAWAAFFYRLPLAHVGTAVCAGVVYLGLYCVLARQVPWTGDDLGRRLLVEVLNAQSGAALVGLFALFAATAETLVRLSRREHAVPYAGAAAVVALVSLSIVTAQGLRTYGEQAAMAAMVYAVYAAGSLFLSARFRQPLLSYFGLGLLAGATLWSLEWQFGGFTPRWPAVLALESLALAVTAAALGWRAPRDESTSVKRFFTEPARLRLADFYAVPLWHAAEAIGAVAIVLGVVSAWLHRAAIFRPVLPEASSSPTWLGISVGSETILRTPEPLITVAAAVALLLVLAWHYRTGLRTWIASALALAGIVHTLNWNYVGLEQPWPAAVLAHATLAVAAGMLLQFFSRASNESQTADRWRADLRRVFVEPLVSTGLVSSALAVPILAMISWEPAWWLAVCIAWLAAIWLVVASVLRLPGLFALGQAALAVATVPATTAWLQRHPWNPLRPIDLADPRVWQAHGIALALLTLCWIAARLALRAVPAARRLLHPGWPAVDRLVAYALVIAQFIVIVPLVLRGVGAELGGLGSPRWQQLQLDAVGPAGWMLAALVVLGLVAALWDRWGREELVLGILALSAPAWLIAGRLAPSVATASALRWGWAAAFVVLAAAIWARRPIVAGLRRAGARFEIDATGLMLAQGLLLAATVLPVLAVTVSAAWLQLEGRPLVGPAAGSLFARLGPAVSYLVPLLAVVAGMVGFALRERSARYAFCAGLVVELAVALAFLLKTGSTGVTLWVVLIQLLTIAAAIWALLWLATRRWLTAWRDDNATRRQLMDAQLGMGAAGNVLLLVPALATIVLDPYRLTPWTQAAGSWIGWAALLLVAAAVGYRQLQLRRRVQPNLAGLVGMAVLALAAITISGLPMVAPEWGYRTLMLAWASYALFVALATWWAASLGTLPGAEGPPQAIVRMAATWVTAAGLLAVALGIKATSHDEPRDLLWAAAAIAIASAAGATMAIWRRREGWAFCAAPGANLAASLVVWYYQRELPFEAWWAMLIEANIIASAAVAMLWLAARKRLYELGQFSVRSSPLLAAQTTIGPIGCVVLLIQPLYLLVTSPSLLPAWTAQLAEPAGWTALVLSAAAAAWYLGQASPRDLVHVPAMLGLGLGAILACHASSWEIVAKEWLSYHVLLASWAALALAMLALGWVGRTWRLARQQGDGSSSPEPVLAASAVRNWTTLIGALATGLAVLHGYADPSGPWWPTGAILAASAAFGLLAIWQRLPVHVYLSGVLVNVAGTVAWTHYGPETLAALVSVNVFCLAATACVWMLIDRFVRPGVTSLELADRPLPYAHAAVLAGAVLLGATTAAFVSADLVGEMPHAAFDRTGWIALGLLAAATLLLLGDRAARFVPATLYFCGLTAIGMALDVRAVTGYSLCWTAAPELAGYALAASLIAWLMWRSVAAGGETTGRPEIGWFDGWQWIVAATAAGLGAFIAASFRFDSLTRTDLAWLSGRPIGPIAVALVLVAAWFMTARAMGRARPLWQFSVFALATLLLSTIVWAALPRTIDLPELHRNVTLMVAAVAVTLAGMAVSRVLPAASDWNQACRRVAPALASLAIVMLVVVLVQEGYYAIDRGRGEFSIATPAVVAVATALAGLMVAAIAFAVRADWDPLQLTDNGRTAYVYAAEVLGLLMGLHIWLTRPHLFHLGFIENYWMFLVLGIAFLGAGLSEWFQRLKLPVLSTPLVRTALLLPLLPAVGYWLPLGDVKDLPLAGPNPAVWFTAALFYGTLAATRRSTALGLLSALAGNIGLATAWNELTLGFTEFPQLYLVPLGLTVLVAEYLNHDRLRSEQSLVLRYIALSLIYLSSATEFMFLHPVGEQLWQPLVLVLLSVAGAMAGLVLRVRSFLIMGISFLVVVMVRMIYFAAFEQHHVWIFWTFCIALGAAIIALFGMFEKRRDRIRAAAIEFSQWQK